jgi:hypothetical protein
LRESRSEVSVHADARASCRSDDRVVMEPSSTSDLLPCRLQYVASLVGGCPDDRCPLWDAGGTVYDGHCVFDELEVRDRQTFESWLLALQTELQHARTTHERTEVRRLYYRLLNESSGA